jgi:hypothetical protein
MSSTPIDTAIVSLLKNSADVAAIVSARIYATQAPQGVALPVIVYVREDGQRSPFMHMAGSTGYVRATYTVSCLASSLQTCRNLARAARRALQFATGSAIRLARVVSDQDLQESPAQGEQLPTYRTDLSVEVTYVETV